MMGSSHQGFYLNALFFQDGGYKTRRIINYFSKETKNEFICVKLVIILISCNEKGLFMIFCQRSKEITTFLLKVKTRFLRNFTY